MVLMKPLEKIPLATLSNCVKELQEAKRSVDESGLLQRIIGSCFILSQTIGLANSSGIA